MHKQVGNQHSKSLLRYTLLLANSTNVIALVFVLVNHKHFGEAFFAPLACCAGAPAPSALLARPLAAGGESVRWWNVDARQYITLITWPAITARRRRRRRGRSRAKTQSGTAS